MGLLDAVFKGVGFLASVTGTAITKVGEVVKQWGERLLSSAQSKHSGDIRFSNTNEVLEDLEIIDAEFIEIERKKQRDGRLAKVDTDRLEELNALRKQKFIEYQESQTVELAIEQTSNPDNYEPCLLDVEKVHILQYQMGQIVLEKKCNNCGRSMFLQHKNRPDGSPFMLSDFFWSCTGYYEDDPAIRCTASQPFRTKDIGFLHRIDIPELSMTNSDLSTIYSHKTVQEVIEKRVKEHVREKDEEILCKVHYVPMILREKKEHTGLVLDMFYLGCPHFGCKQVVKLKSPAQLAAFLRRKEGEGIL